MESSKSDDDARLAPPDDPREALRDALVPAFPNIGDDGRLPAEEVESIRSRAGALRARGLVPRSPEELFGPWEALPDKVRRHLRSSVEAETRRRIRVASSNRLRDGLFRTILTVQRFFHRRRARRGVRLCEFFFQLLSARPARMRASLHTRLGSVDWRWRRRPRLSSILAYFGLSPYWLSGPYVTRVYVHPRHRSYLLDRGRNIVSGFLLGLDLVPAEQATWCVESNLSPGLPGGAETVSDQMAQSIVEAAEEAGAKHLFWISGARGAINPVIFKTLHQAGSAMGVEPHIFDDPWLPAPLDLPPEFPEPKRGRRAPWPLPDDSFVVNVRGHDSLPDHVVNGKDHVLRNLAAGLAHTGNPHIRIPLMSVEPPDVDPPGPGFPNLVYKYPDEHQARGVFFLRARDSEHARELAREVDRRTGWTGGLFQPFVASRLRPGGRVCHLRAMLLLTPLTVKYVGGVRLESAIPVPESLPEGIVPHPNLFASNLILGGSRTFLDPEEHLEIEKPAQGVGEALQAVLARGLEVEVNPETHEGAHRR